MLLSSPPVDKRAPRLTRMTTTVSPADSHLPADTSILSARYRATTIGMVALVALHAFEALAVAAAMPTVAEALDGLRLYALAFGGTLATSVIGMTLAGRWADRHGPARPLWYGLGCFVLGLLLAGFAMRMGMLVAGRLMQGLGAGAISVSLYVMVGRSYPEHLRPKVFAAFSAGWVVPSMVGPALSGLIVQHLGWRWVFLAVPLLAIPAALLLRPALARMQSTVTVSDDKGRGNVVRWASGASLAALLLYLGGQQQGMAALLCIGVAMLALLFCVHRLLPAGTLILRRGLPSVIALRGIAAAAFFACEAYLPLLLQRERGLSPSWAGAVLSLGALGWFAGSWLQGHQQRGWSRQQLLRVGTVMMTFGIAATLAVLFKQMPLPVALVGWAVTGFGMGMIYASLSVLTLSLSAPHEQGANTSALQLSEALSVTTALAVSGALFAMFVETAPHTGYLLCLAITFGLAVLAALIARRV
ncbi:TPA: MFS transporter [Stenotrophomonas maltophilia]|uniref:MFS transporter n=1 Tax=Stenotrophomonas maltophilia TaxID=40324 RepID=A0A2J0UGT3_STEMA|nr:MULTISPECIES: MFS transporter [Stenotrophomonas]PJL34046.1 MFS transporter [Stenotrophomonas maltophilia]HDS1137630.1 MFS transporter [Stenotrophomonas maltophilia]HDS1146016.1 MFS transporter [Stenotrophomonas maltophilia]HDS1160179.1 MFS transporter [Stenotrophomonas maltophilia]